MPEQRGPPDPDPFPPTAGQRIIALLGRAAIRLLGRSLKIEVIGEDHQKEAREVSSTGRIAVALWHGCQFPLVYAWRRKNMAVLTSLSRDGTLQRLVLGGLGFHIVRGSSSRGAVRGLVGIIKAGREGYDTIFAVDGPRGPYHVVKVGILYAAMKTGAVVVPSSSAVRRAKIFHNSWDKYILPFPFTKTVVAYGEGIPVPTDSSSEDLELLAVELGEQLDSLTRLAEETISAG